VRRALLLLLLVSCARRSPTTIEVPEDVAWIAVLELAPDDTVLRVGPLTAWKPNQSLPLYASTDARLGLVGWSEAQLSGADAPLGARIELVPPLACRNRLPVPRLFGGLDDEGALRTFDLAAAPPLTSPDFQVCGGAEAISVVIDSCTSCRPKVTAQGSCRFRYDFAACDQQSIELMSWADGGGCFIDDRDGAFVSCAPTGPSGLATDTATCLLQLPLKYCQVSAFVAPRGPPFDVHEISFVEGPDHLPYYLRRFGNYGPAMVWSGYAHDLLAYEREILISTTGTVSYEPCEAQEMPPGVLQRRDLDGELISTATVPSCLSQMRGDPEGEGFVATYIDGARQWWIGRFERDGTMLEREPIIPTDGGYLDGRVAYPWMVEPFGATWLVAFGGVILDGNRLRTQDRVHVFDQYSLAPREDRSLEELGVTVSLRANASNLVLGGSLRPSISIYDTASLQQPAVVKTMLPTDPTENGSDGLYDIAVLDRRILIAASPPQAVYLFDRSANYELRRFVDNGTGKPNKFIYLKDQQKMIVLATRDGEGPGQTESVLTVFDLETERFRPGVWPLGYGPVAAASRDTMNRIYLLLPWAHKVLRLTLHDDL
jgi:hypothetical protein